MPRLFATPRALRPGFRAASSMSSPPTNSRCSRFSIVRGKTEIIPRLAGPIPGFSRAENRSNYARRRNKWDGPWPNSPSPCNGTTERDRLTLRSLKPICLPTAFAYAAGALCIDVESCVGGLLFQLDRKPGHRRS